MKPLKLSAVIAAFLLILCLMAGCAGSASSGSSASEAASDTGTDKVASASEMVTPEEVDDGSLTPIAADQLNDGTYPITVDSSSSMFVIDSCQLTVDNGKMTAAMTMGGKGYLYLYMGTAEQAAAADEKDFIPYTEDANGAHVYTVPVSELDYGIDCAAFSKNKEQWYPRTLVFRADSLPTDAFKPGVLKTVSSLGLADGTYEVGVTLGGGTGRSGVESPAKLTIEGGKAMATIIWSSSNYDYMVVNDQHYDPEDTEGNSTFTIPVEFFDYNMAVLADTTAMSEPHEIAYTLNFDSASITQA